GPFAPTTGHPSAIGARALELHEILALSMGMRRALNPAANTDRIRSRSMLLSFRKTRVPELGAALAVRALVHPSYRLQVVDNRALTAEDDLFPRGTMARKGHLARPIVTVVLAGEARLRAFGREKWLRPGEVSVVSEKGAVRTRQQGDVHCALVLEFDPRAG